MSSITRSCDVLPQVIHAYASCRTFRCSAQLTRRITTDTTTESRFMMRLAYARPQRLFLQWWLDDHKDSKHHTLIANDGIIVRHSWSELAWQCEAAISDALASYAGISCGLALHIPSLLTSYDDYSLFARVDRQVMQTDQIYVISGAARGDIERNVVVRATDMAIIRMQEKYAIPNGTVESESEYHKVELTYNED